MTSTQTPLKKQRLLGPDLARGVMLLLIAMAYAGVYVASGFGVDATHESWLDQATTFASHLVLDNRAFPMFAILFGYGLAWSIARRTARKIEPAQQKRRLRRRALMLLIFGAVHAFLIYPGEILMSYGLALLVTGWLLFASDRAQRVMLWITGIFYIVVIPYLMIGAIVFADDAMAQAVPGYSTAEDWAERLVGLPISPVYIAIAYPLLFLVVLGYRAGRARLFEHTAERRKLLLSIAIGGISISVLGALPSALMTTGATDTDVVAEGLFLGLQTLTGVAGGAGYAACFALGSDQLERLIPTVTRAVAAVGKRSLTFYIFNSAVVALILHPELIGVGSNVGHFGALVVAILSWIVAVLLASWLERADRPGPLEQLMRRGVDR